MTARKTHTFEEVLKLDQAQLREIIFAAAPLHLDALDGQQYQGVDLSLPDFMHKLLWTTFRKTFLRDPVTGIMRGWNVRMEQRGVDGPQAPKLRGGVPWTFAHYEVRPASGLTFPGGWRGEHYLDYSRVGNSFGENLAMAPLVAVNAGSMDLLLGWEVFRLGPMWIPLPDYWVLRREGPIEYVAPPLRAPKS